MKTVLKIFTIAIFSVALLQAAAFEKTADSNALKLLMVSEKPLTTGNNTLTLSIEEAEYKDADVSFKVFMPAMPGMPAMESTSEAKNLGGGKYEVNVNFSMAGTWQVHIFITPKSGKKVRVKSSLNI